IHHSRVALRRQLAKALAPQFETIYTAYDHSQPYEVSARAIANRSLKNLALAYLVLVDDHWLSVCDHQYRQASNMTDALAALTCLVNSDRPLAEGLRSSALADYYQRWQSEALVVNHWFSVQANCPLPGGLARVKALQQHPAYDPRNPNKIRSLVRTFCNSNA